VPRANVALSPSSGRIRPRQFGPTTRSRWRRAFSKAACSSFAPAGPASENPAVMTTAARTPARPHCSITSGTVRGGVAITARSTRGGTLPIASKQGTPCTLLYLGFTAYSAPRYFAARMFWTSTAPTEPARSLAPTSATDCGSNRGVR